MTPREKAVELVHKFAMENKYYERAKQCALIAVDEILKAYPHTFDKEIEYTSSGDEIIVIKNTRCNNEFWYNVKQEIEKL
jgi:hypothetical protein